MRASARGGGTSIRAQAHRLLRSVSSQTQASVQRLSKDMPSSPSRHGRASLDGSRLGAATIAAGAGASVEEGLARSLGNLEDSVHWTPWLFRVIPRSIRGHVETVLPSLLRRGPGVLYRRECVRVPDGGVVTLDWLYDEGATKDARRESHADAAPLVVLLPGLAGGSSDGKIEDVGKKHSSHALILSAFIIPHHQERPSASRPSNEMSLATVQRGCNWREAEVRAKRIGLKILWQHVPAALIDHSSMCFGHVVRRLEINFQGLMLAEFSSSNYFVRWRRFASGRTCISDLEAYVGHAR